MVVIQLLQQLLQPQHQLRHLPCSISTDPQIVRHGETSTFNIMITGGPVNGSFSPSNGGCSSFTDSTGTSCTTTFLTMPGKNTFTLSVSNAKGSSSCFADVFVGCKNYRVWNNTGQNRDFIVDGTCRDFVGDGGEITTSSLLLDRGETIKGYSLTHTACMGSSTGSLSYDQAMSADIGVRGGDGDCQVNFTGSDR